MKLILAHNYHTLIEAMKIKIKSDGRFYLIYVSETQPLSIKMKNFLTILGFDIIAIPEEFLEAKKKYNLVWFISPFFDFYIKFKKIELEIEFDNISEVLVFNDEEVIFRFLIDKIKSYILYQEGVANYLKFENRNKFFHAISQSVFSSIFKFPYLPLGRHYKCKKIIYTSKNEYAIPADIREKVIFQSYENNILNKYTAQLVEIFNINDDLSIYDCIILTQPIEIYGLSSLEKLEIYRFILDKLRCRYLSIAFKIHPRESLELYKTIGVDVLGRYPVELIEEFNPKVNFYSLCSSGDLIKHKKIINDPVRFEMIFKTKDLDYITSNIDRSI
ncbi:polysialyltransferase family glycosyltransferase [Aeromonas veronii]|uniref:polysialyltransferase family glycosyltransferase n=1 Tax=Aeromonas veronii TaxID=654 RepID=UPI003A1413F5